MFPILALVVAAAEAPADWAKQEEPFLKNVEQVTKDFVRAGEGYFSPDMKKIIFQAEERGTGNPFYQIFVQDLKTGRADRVSPGKGKTTCAYFHPTEDRIIFASTHTDPNAEAKYKEEYAHREEEKKTGKRRRYVWDFDPYMQIYQAKSDGTGLKALTDAKGYNAEGSYSSDGKRIVFCSNRSGDDNFELYIMDADGSNVRQLTKAPGCYNGGPFFSPDGKRVIFRSDRDKKDHLQLYVINSDGTGEKRLTNNLDWVYWAPYWHPDGKHLIYTAADHSNPMVRPNYDLYWMNIDTGKETRLTFAPGADVLPVISPDGKKIMWTSTRDGRMAPQLFLADFTPPLE